MNDIGAYEHQSMVVVFEPTDGRIVHSHAHYYVTLGGRKPPDDKQLETKAAELIANRGIAVDRMAFLHLEPGAIKPDAVYGVDTKTRKLVEIPKPQRPKR
jgi:hypothetical protein